MCTRCVFGIGKLYGMICMKGKLTTVYSLFVFDENIYLYRKTAVDDFYYN